ncbi:hypothetical protein-signal peptide prediction [Rhodopirellula baltica SH 1]|uniref:Uncharacterized protein n=1 Tax=Rhodopirellula baltica (strain DSM 10527 / NCIMB 13988 / SH1) TaxID=243090 RepID=Q7ULW7_RHOBA|nr:hypothetical protein-signal peptide prediction [Rhodopirellula baltica SH 1]
MFRSTLSRRNTLGPCSVISTTPQHSETGHLDQGTRDGPFHIVSRAFLKLMSSWLRIDKTAKPTLLLRWDSPTIRVATNPSD